MAKCGMKVNTCKTKYMGSGVENPVKETGKYPCSVCSSGVGANSILCESCNKWCHKRCSGIKGNIVASHCFKCPKCSSDNPQNTTGDRNDLTIADMVIEQVSSFPYLGDVVQVDGAADAAIRSRVHSTWNKWKVIGGLLVDRNIPLKSRKQLYMTCVRPVMLYGSETWPVKRTLVSILQRTEMKMIRWMLHVQRLMDRFTNEDLLKRIGLSNVERSIRINRLRWYGHVERSLDQNLMTVKHLVIPGKTRSGRPKTNWRGLIQHDLNSLNLRPEDAQNRDNWRHCINNV